MNISQGPHFIDGTLTFSVTTHDAATGALTDADAVPAFRVYEDETGTAIATGNMAKLDDAGTTGFYSEQLTLSAANGYEAGKSYNVYVSAAVDSVTGATCGGFKVSAALTANVASVTNGVNGLIRAGTAQSVGATTLVMDSGAGFPDDILEGATVVLTNGANEGARAIVTGNTGSSDTLTLAGGWTGGVTPSSTPTFALFASGKDASLAEIAAAVWDLATSGHTTSGTFGEQVKTDIDAILADTDVIGATGAGLTSLATAAELAKVPKSDSNVTWNATAAAQLQSEATDALAAYDPPTKAELDSAVSPLATASSLATVAGYLDTEIAAILADTNELQADWADGGRLDTILDARASQSSVDDLPTNAELATALGTADDAVLTQVALVKAVTDKLDDTLVDQGGGTYGFTESALQEAPTGEGGGGTDWDADERTAIRAILGIPGSGTAPADPSAGILDTIRDSVATRASQASADAILADTDAIDARLPSDPADQSLLLAAANAIVADTEDIQAKIGAPAATLAADIATRATQAQVAAELAAYDAPTKAELDAAVAPLATAAALGDVPTTAELAVALAAADDAVLAQVALVKAKTDALPSDPADQSAVEAAIDAAEAAILAAIGGVPTGGESADALLDLAAGIETGLTVRQGLRLMVAAMAGKVSGAGTSTVTIRDVADTKDRMVATVDEDGNRAAVTRDVS